MFCFGTLMPMLSLHLMPWVLKNPYMVQFWDVGPPKSYCSFVKIRQLFFPMITTAVKTIVCNIWFFNFELIIDISVSSFTQITKPTLSFSLFTNIFSALNIHSHSMLFFDTKYMNMHIYWVASEKFSGFPGQYAPNHLDFRCPYCATWI